MSDGNQAASGHVPLKRSTIFFYSLPQIPVSLAMMALALVLPNFYASDLGLSLAIYANITLAVTGFDIFTDVMVGRLSDKTRSRIGRRKPWILGGVPVMMLGLYMTFMPTGSVDGWYLFTWTMVLRFGWTLIQIPYLAWGAELSPEYQERTVITGWRAMSGAFGNIAVWGALTFMWLGFDLGGSSNVVEAIGIMCIVAVPLIVGFTCWKVPERDDVVRSVVPLWPGLKLMWKNGPFRQLITGFLVGFSAFAAMLQCYIFYIRSVIGEEEAWVAFLFLSNLIGFLAVPFWIWASRKIGKHRAWLVALAVISVTGPFYMLLGPGDIWLMIPIMVIASICSGTFQAMPDSMKADVIDLDVARTGEDRAALYFSAWNFAQKFAMSIAGWLTLQGLYLAGYNPALGTANDAQGIWALKIMFGVVPSIFFLSAFLIVWNYPITEQRHAKLRGMLDRRRARRAGKVAPGVAPSRYRSGYVPGGEPAAE